MDGIVPVSPTRDTPGIIAQYVPDVILLDRIICRRPSVSQAAPLKGLRIGLPTNYFYNDLEPDVALAAETTIRLLASKNVTFVEADIPDLARHNKGASFPITVYEFPQSLEHYIKNFVAGVSFPEVVRAIRSPDVANILNAQISDNLITESEYELERRFFRPRLQTTYDYYFKTHELDAILFPTAPLTAKPIGHDLSVVHNGSMSDTFKIFVRNVDPGSNAGVPGLSLPVCLSSKGLPIGMEIDGSAGSDDRLLAIGLAIEEAVNFRHRPILL